MKHNIKKIPFKLIIRRVAVSLALSALVPLTVLTEPSPQLDRTEIISKDSEARLERLAHCTRIR